MSQSHVQFFFPRKFFANCIVAAQRARHAHAINLFVMTGRGCDCTGRTMVRKIKVALNTFCARSDLAAATLSSSVKWLLLRLRPSQSMTSVWIAMRCSTRVLSTLIEKNVKAFKSHIYTAADIPSGSSTTSLSQTKLPPLNTNPLHNWPSLRPWSSGMAWTRQ